MVFQGVLNTDEEHMHAVGARDAEGLCWLRVNHRSFQRLYVLSLLLVAEGSAKGPVKHFGSNGCYTALLEGKEYVPKTRAEKVVFHFGATALVEEEAPPPKRRRRGLPWRGRSAPAAVVDQHSGQEVDQECGGDDDESNATNASDDASLASRPPSSGAPERRSC